MEQEPSPVSLARKKKWLIPLVATIALVIIGGIIALVLTLNRSKQENAPPAQSNTNQQGFRAEAGGTPMKYAGNAVYDACNLLPFDTVRQKVNNYQTILDMVGTDEKPSDPLMIEHRYFDRDIAAPLGKDAQPRSTGTTVGQAGVTASSFISESDSNCWYGQGKEPSLGLGKTFAKVYVTQKPTPLSADLLAYFGTLQKAGSQDGINAYIEPQKDSGGFLTSIVHNTSTSVVAILKTSTQELAQDGTLSIMQTLSEAPRGPMNIIYAKAWSSMPNPCRLFSASDFEKFIGKPASALAEDTMNLSEIGGRLMRRDCKRLELERLDGSPIAKTTVVIRLADSESSAKKYVEDIKKNEADQFTIQPLKQRINLADDAYIKIIGPTDKPTNYELDMRIGAAVIIIGLEPESGVDSSVDAYAARILPIARSIAENYRAQ